MLVHPVITLTAFFAFQLKSATEHSNKSCNLHVFDQNPMRLPPNKYISILMT